MTITSTASEVSYAGDNVSTVFPIPFVFDTSADIKVIRTDPDGNPVTLSSGFSISGGSGSTGDCTLTSALASGYTLTLLDDPALTQDADYTANDAFPADTHEGALDHGVRISKRLSQLLKKCLRVDDGDPSAGAGMLLGSVQARKGKYLFFNAVTGAVEFATSIIGSTLSRSIIGQFLNPQTTAEAAAGVTPVDYAYPEGVDLRYGVVRDDATNNQTALQNLILVGAQGVQIVLTAGVARHSGTLDWSHSYLRVRAEGKSQLRHTGSGAANLIDGGAASSLTNLNFEGYIEELGNASTTYCWDIRALYRSRLDIRAKNSTQAGCRIRFAVLCDIRFALTNNDVAITTQPLYGMTLNQRNAGEQVAGCRFPNLFIEGLSANKGLQLASCFECTFDAGSCEGCDVGVEVNGSTNVNNTFINFDLEANTTADMTVSGGSGLALINCQSQSVIGTANIILSGGDSTTFVGGFHRWIDTTGSTNSGFYNVQVPDSVTTGIQGTGTRKAVNVVKVDANRAPVANPTSGFFYDVLGNSGTFTPTIYGGTTPGTQTYAANGQKGYYVVIGKMIFFSIYLQLASNAGGAGNATISLPVPPLAGSFASLGSTNAYQNAPVLDFTGVTLGGAGRGLSLRVSPGGTTGLLLETDSGGVSNFIAITSISGTATIILSGWYLLG